MIKELTKQEFRELTMPSGAGKEAQGARMELNPNNYGIINGKKYTIETIDNENKVILTKVEE